MGEIRGPYFGEMMSAASNDDLVASAQVLQGLAGGEDA